MILRLNEVLAAYAGILDKTEPVTTDEALWHAGYNFSEDRQELSPGTVSLETNIIVASSDKELIEEKGNPFDKFDDMIERAHPKPVYIADATADGGLVENQNELHNKLVQMINKYPNGSTGHKYASLLQDLLKTAQQLDDSGDHAAANMIDATASEIQELLKKKSSLSKTALLPLLVPAVPWVLGVLGLAGAASGSWFAFKGRQENLVKDLEDLLSNIDSWKDDTDFAPFKTTIYDMRAEASKLKDLAYKWLSASQAYKNERSSETANAVSEASQDLLETYQKYTALRDDIKDIKAPGALFPLFWKYDRDVKDDLDSALGLAKEEASRQRTTAPTISDFDSEEMKNAVVNPESATPPAPIRMPLDKSKTAQTQLFINEVFRPIAPATGVVNKEWYLGIKDMVDSLRTRMQKAAMIENPENAPITANELNISKFVSMNGDGNYSLLVDAPTINRLFEVADNVEQQANMIYQSRMLTPYKATER